MMVLEAREQKKIEKGIQESKQEGIEITQEKSAQNMLKNGLPIELVVKYSEISNKKVERNSKRLDRLGYLI